MTHCGECPFFKYEDIDGYGVCDISGFAKNCSMECSFCMFDQLTNEKDGKGLVKYRPRKQIANALTTMTGGVSPTIVTDLATPRRI